jgi:hypothetical protein
MPSSWASLQEWPAAVVLPAAGQQSSLSRYRASIPFSPLDFYLASSLVVLESTLWGLQDSMVFNTSYDHW